MQSRQHGAFIDVVKASSPTPVREHIGTLQRAFVASSCHELAPPPERLSMDGTPTQNDRFNVERETGGSVQWRAKL